MSASVKRTISASASVASKNTVASSSRTLLLRKRGGTTEKEIRSRLLSKLGIYDPSCAGADSSLLSANSLSSPDPATSRRTDMLRGMGLGGLPVGPRKLPTAQSSVGARAASVGARPGLRGAVPFKEPLKCSSIRPARKGGSSSLLFGGGRPVAATAAAGEEFLATTDANQRRAKIAFDDNVSVIAIPMRSEFSSRVKSRIWSNRYEIHENASRNTVEFAAEGWDWRTVTEDDGMFVCTQSGDLIHPVHCQQFYQ